MSIMSDNWIRAQCEKPTHIVKKSRGGIEYASFPFTAFQKQLFDSQKLYSELNITNNKLPESLETYTMDEINPITEEQLRNWKPMIYPFVNSNIRVAESGKKIVSYGVSCYGYDVRLANKFKIFTNVNASVIDPLGNNDSCYVDMEGDYCIIPPNSYMLGHTIETFCIPDDILVACVGKSTYARLAAIVNVTPIEPGFEGQVVIEIANSTNLPLKVYANQGIAQFLFFEGNERCTVSYRDKGGKYQGQTGITTARL